MVNPRDIAGNAEEEDNASKQERHCQHKNQTLHHALSLLPETLASRLVLKETADHQHLGQADRDHDEQLES